MRSVPEKLKGDNSVCNYMDQYEDEVAFYRGELCKNRGSDNVMYKKELINVIKTELEKVTTSKEKLVDVLILMKGIEYLRTLPTGITAGAFQRKFAITYAELQVLVRMGVIKDTGYRAKKSAYGGKTTYRLYDSQSYFTLTKEEVQNRLRAYQKKRQTERKTEKSVSR